MWIVLEKVIKNINMENFDPTIIRNFAVEEVRGLRKKFKKLCYFRESVIGVIG
jgi:hypothetical protein